MCLVKLFLVIRASSNIVFRLIEYEQSFCIHWITNRIKTLKHQDDDYSIAKGHVIHTKKFKINIIARRWILVSRQQTCSVYWSTLTQIGDFFKQNNHEKTHPRRCNAGDRMSVNMFILSLMINWIDSRTIKISTEYWMIKEKWHGNYVKCKVHLLMCKFTHDYTIFFVCVDCFVFVWTRRCECSDLHQKSTLSIVSSTIFQGIERDFQRIASKAYIIEWADNTTWEKKHTRSWIHVSNSLWKITHSEMNRNMNFIQD